MKEYEVMIEDINPCGGEAYARKEILEIETADPEAWVKENARFPITSIGNDSKGDLRIITGNEAGYITRYTFSE